MFLTIRQASRVAAVSLFATIALGVVAQAAKASELVDKVGYNNVPSS